CASVLATTNSTPCRFAASILSTALVPPPPTPITVIRGLKSVCWVCGMVRFSVIATSPRALAIRFPGCYAKLLDSCRASQAILQKIDDAPQQAGRPLGVQVDVVHRAAFTCRPRQQSGGGGERRTRCGIGQAAQCDRTSQPYLLVQH